MEYMKEISQEEDDKLFGNGLAYYIAVFSDGEYKNIFVVQAEDIDDADHKLKEQGWEGWSSLRPIEFDEHGVCFAINGLR